jgi:hypothetical protein
LDVTSLTPEQRQAYERGLYTSEEIATMAGQRGAYVAAVAEATPETQRQMLRDAFSDPNVVISPRSPDQEDRLNELWHSGLLSITSQGYTVNDLGKDVLAHVTGEAEQGGEEKSLTDSNYSDNLKYGTRAFAFKAADGTDWWMQWTTNAFRDREREIFSTKALEEYVERHRDEDVKGEFWYRHIPGTKFANVVWQAMVGRFLVQAGPFDDTPIGNYFRKFFLANPDGHDDVAPHGWGTSHGYYFDGEDRKDGVYNWMEIRESTVLPVHIASNIWSPAPRILRKQRSRKMNAQEEKELREIGGDELVKLVKQQGAEQTKRLEGYVAFKAVSEGVVDQFRAVAEMVEGEARDLLETAIAQLEEEMMGYEEAAEGEMPEEEEMGYEEAGSGEMPEEMMPEQKDAEQKDAEQKDAEQKDVNQEQPEPQTQPVSREEIAEGMKVLGDQILEDVSSALGEAVKAALAPVNERLAALEREDGEKIAEKAAQTPAASVADILRSVRKDPRAAVKSGDELEGRKPEEAEPNPHMAGGMYVPSFIGNMMRGTDQRKD